MSEHTPGPWEAVELDGKPVNDPAIMSAKHCVATCWINDIPRQQAAANARLLAQAPAMLRSLKVLVDAYGLPSKKNAEAPIIKTAREIIAKATGAA